MTPLRILYHFDDLGEHGRVPNHSRAEAKYSLLVDGAADHCVFNCFIHGERFTSQHGLVYATVTFDNHSVDWDFDTGFDDDDVA